MLQSTKKPLALSLLALGHVTAASAVAQHQFIPEDTRRGAASLWPTGLILTTGNGPSEVLLKPAGDQTAIPDVWMQSSSNDSAANYRVTDVGQPLFGVQIDAISTGNAFLAPPVDGDPFVDEAWLGVSASVSQDVATLRGSHFAGANPTPGSEVATYYYGGSVGIPSTLAGNTALEMSLEHLGLENQPTFDVSALDYGIGLITFNDPSLLQAFFQSRKHLYFSLTASSAASQGSGFAADLATNSTVSADPAAIYVMRWSGTSWLGPFLYATPAMLGLQPGSDIDALDVDHDTGVLIFSATKDSDYVPTVTETSQIMIAQLTLASHDLGSNEFVYYGTATGVPSEPLKDGGVPVGPKVGVAGDDGEDPDELDALCGIDPESILAFTDVATPRHKYPGIPGPALGLSGVRETATPNQFTFHVTGWGGSMPHVCTAALYRRTKPDPNLPVAPPWTFVASQIRTPGDDSVEFTTSVLSEDVAEEFVVLCTANGGVTGASYIAEILNFEPE